MHRVTAGLFTAWIALAGIAPPALAQLRQIATATDQRTIGGELVVGRDGMLYGVSSTGGHGDASSGWGTIFRVDDATGRLTTVYSFRPETGYHPQVGMTLGTDGRLYGTTAHGGDGVTKYGAMFAFDPRTASIDFLIFLPTYPQLRADGTSFIDYMEPAGRLVERDGWFYGATRRGGTAGRGTIFKARAGQFVVLHSFSGADGSDPTGVTAGSDGRLYGTTKGGGTHGLGTLFSATPEGRIALLHAFDGRADGGGPSPLVSRSDGVLVGVAPDSGGRGRVFEWHPGSGLLWRTDVPLAPIGAPVQAADGRVWSAFGASSSDGMGQILEFRADGNALGQAPPTFPTSAITEGADGALYGTTRDGVYRMVPIRVTSPAPGMKLFKDLPRRIRWSRPAVEPSADVSVFLSTVLDGALWPVPGCQGVFALLETCLGTFDSAPFLPGTKVVVHAIVNASQNAALHAVRDAVPSVTFDSSRPTITINSPTAGAPLVIGETTSIAWSYDLGASEAFEVDVSRDGGLTFERLGSSLGALPGLSKYEWKVSAPASVDARVRVSARDLPTLVATVSVQIGYPAAAPVAEPGSVTTAEDVPVVGSLTAFDLNGDTLTFSIRTNGSLGTATVTNGSTGAFLYTPRANLNGTDSFTFTAKDSTGLESNVGTITVTITPVDDLPPAILIRAPAAGAMYARGAVIPTDFQCTSGYGVASCATAGGAPSGLPLDTGTPGVFSFDVTATDSGGSTATTRVRYTVVHASSIEPADVWVSYDTRMSIIDTQTNAIRGHLSGISGPYAVVFSPDGSRAYVTGGREVRAFSTAPPFGPVSAVAAVGAGAVHLALSPSGDILYAASYVDGTMTILDAHSMSVMATVPVGPGPWGLATTVWGEVLVSSPMTGTVRLLSADGQPVQDIVIGDNPHSIVVLPDGSKAYVAVQARGSAVEIDLATRRVTREIAASGQANELALSPDAKRLFVTGAASSGDTAVIDLAAGRRVASLPHGSYLAGVVTAANGPRLYVVVVGTGDLRVVDTSAFETVATVDLGAQARFAAMGLASPDLTIEEVSVAPDRTGRLVARLSGATGPAPHRMLRFALPASGEAAFAVTDEDGRATIDLAARPMTIARGDTLVVSFRGDTHYRGAAASAPIVMPDVATAIEIGGTGPFMYDGIPHPATVMVIGTDGVFLNGYTVAYSSGEPPAAVGSHTVTVTFPGAPGYLPASATAVISIVPAPVVVSVQPLEVTFDRKPHPAVVTAIDALGVALQPLTVRYRLAADEDDPSAWSEKPPIRAGRYHVHALYAGDANHSSAEAHGTVTIHRARATVSVTGSTFVYDGEPHAALAVAIGALNEELELVQVTYAPGDSAPVNVGRYVATGSFAGSEDYEPATGTGEIVITPASPVLTVTGGTFDFDGQAHAVIASVTGVQGEDLGAPHLLYGVDTTAPKDAGTYAVTAAFDGLLNYVATSGTTELVIRQATPTVVVTGGTFGYDGQPHGARAAATGVLGEDLGDLVVTYDPGVTTPSEAGRYVATAAFAGTRNYKPSTGTATVVIEPGAPTISVAGGTFTYDAQPHAAGGSVTGVGGQSIGTLSFTYNGSPTLPVSAGIYTVVGTFAGAGNYRAGSATTQLQILPAPLAIEAIDSTRVYGDADPNVQPRYSGFVTGEGPAVLDGWLAFTTPATVHSGVGMYPVTPGGVSSPNYAITFVPGTMTIVPVASRTTTFSSSNPSGYLQSIALRANVLPSQGRGTVTGTVEFLVGTTLLGAATMTDGAATINVVLPVGSHEITARYSGDLNVQPSVSGVLTQTVYSRQESSTTALKVSSSQSKLGDPVTFTIDVTSASGTPSGIVTLWDGAREVGAAVLDRGRAQLVLATLSAGAHSLTASYPGNDSTTASVSAPVAHTVWTETAPERTTLRISPKQIRAAAADVEVIVSAVRSAPSGRVSVSVDGGPPIVLDLAAGRSSDAVATTSVSLSRGTHIITAIYLGSDTHAGTSGEIQVRVQ